MTKERIEIIRQSLIPFVKKELLKINYEGLGKSDAKEFEKDLNEVLDLASKALEQPTTQEILSHIETGITATGQSDSYCVGFCNALVWLKSCITHEEPQYFEDGKKGVGVNDN